jgi:hypothetical protein
MENPEGLMEAHCGGAASSSHVLNPRMAVATPFSVDALRRAASSSGNNQHARAVAEDEIAGCNPRPTRTRSVFTGLASSSSEVFPARRNEN